MSVITESGLRPMRPLQPRAPLQQGIRERIPTSALNGAGGTGGPSEASGPSLTAKALRYVVLGSAVLLVVALCLFLVAVYFGDVLSRAGHSADTQKLEIVVANNVLQVPGNTIRFPVQRSNGARDRLDLYLHWPSLSGYSDPLKEAFNDASGETDLVFMTLEPRTMSFDMSGRLNPIYSVFFNGLGIRTEKGLIRQPLDESGGFIDEDMYYQPDSPYPFATRCVREASSTGAPFCIRDVHVGKELMVTYRFHKKLLGQWFELDQAIRNYAKSMIINQPVSTNG